MTRKKKSTLKDFRKQRVNANKHTAQGLELLRGSMTQNGWIGAITAAADGEVFDGSARLETIGGTLEGDPIVVETDGTRAVIVKRTDIKSAGDERAQRLALEANRIAQLDLSWDAEVLARLDQRIKDGLFTDKDLKELQAAFAAQPRDAQPKTDQAKKLQKKWGTRSGDLWQVGGHRLACGDCTDPRTVESVMQGKKADLGFADPPYNAGVDDWDKGFKWHHDWLADRCKYVVVTPGISSAWEFMRSTSMPYKWTLAAYISNGRARSAVGFGWWMYAPLFSNGSVFKQKPDAIEIVLEVGQANGEHHRGQKPPKFMEWVVGLYGDSVVLDCFCGSGTTLVTCQNLGRTCNAIEIDPAYVAVTLQRMQDAFPEVKIKKLK